MTATAEVRYAGLATRAISFVIDAVVLNVVALVVEVGGALILSILHLPKDVHTVIVVLGGVAYALWLIGYFAGFWSTTGQTPGARVMEIRVVSADGGQLKLRRAALRVVGVFLAALPLFAGFVGILYDSRRRGFQDHLAGTVVIRAPQLSVAESLRTRRRVATGAARGAPSVAAE
jgi:uncharacterized RDD family membrane protein YckC